MSLTKKDKFIFAITDSFKDCDMLKVVSNNIRFDYKQKLFSFKVIKS